MTTATAATTSTTSSPTPTSPGTGRAGGGRPDLLVAHNLTELIGRTPLLQVPSLDPADATIYAKIEAFNPLSSSKDRVALAMITGAEHRGELGPRGTVIEASSGNTGIALAALSAARGYGCIVVMPDSATVERIRIIESFGAQVELTPAADGYVAAITRAEDIHNATPDSWFSCQHTNPDNVRAHRETTGPEIWDALGDRINTLVCGIGTGGTISGIAGHLKEHKPDIHVVGVEPRRSPILSEGWGGSHRIPGLNGGFLADTTDTSLIDSVVSVTDDEAYEASRRIMFSTGLSVGISSGAAYQAACLLARQPTAADETIVTVFPDTGERYLSWEPAPAS